jgi:quinol monooxygenase YgiN
MIHTLVRFQVSSGKADEFEQIHRKLVELMKAQSGCIEIRAHRSLANPTEYMVYGTWENKRAWERAHQHPECPGLFKTLPVVEQNLSSGSFFELIYT